MYADVVGLCEVPAEIRRPTNRVISLQQTMPYPVSHCDSKSFHSVTGDQDDWPDPPPWPDTEGQIEPLDQPMIERLDQLMEELLAVS